MYQTILVPLDGSKRAERILPHVERIAHCSKGTVVLLRVLEPEPILVSPYDAQTYVPRQEEIEERKAALDSYLAGLEGEFRERKIQAKRIVSSGPVVEAIIDVAKRENVDLIAMASHGRSGLSRVFYGSVAAGVLQRIDRPLLLIRADDV